MPAGDGGAGGFGGLLRAPDLSPADQQRLERTRRLAEQRSGLTFALYLGLADSDPRRTADAMLDGLSDPSRSVLVLCDPDQRALEIVTGSVARRVLDDVDCRLAAASMQTSFAAGDLTGGLVAGLVQLGQAASRPRTLHLERVTG